MAVKNYWVYILLCNNGNYYTGYTSDLARRYQEHLQGACKYTRSFKPEKIAQSWKISGEKSLAMMLENRIKRLSKFEKAALISDPKKLFDCIKV